MSIIKWYTTLGAHKQRGVSMIEMLITLVIISIGLLGVAALQSRGQLFTQGSYIVSQAVTQAYDIMDRMRANPTFARNVIDGGAGYITGFSDSPYYKKSPQDLRKEKHSYKCDLAPCLLGELRDADLDAWYLDLAKNLPQGTGKIVAVHNGVTVTYTITIQWTLKESEREAGGATTRQQEWSITL